MRSVEYKLTREDVLGHFNQSYFLSFKDKKGNHKVKVSKGSNDEFYVFREGELTYALTVVHSPLTCVGLEIFGPDRSSEKGFGLLGENFLQGLEQVEDILGKDGCCKARYWMAKVLSDYCGM